MRPVDYDERQYRNYARGRALGAERLHTWLSAFAEMLPARRPLDGLDLGSGTGRFTPALASAFGPVVGVEPSDRMREIAERTGDDVEYLPGSAEEIPLPDDAVDYTLMFLAWHHVADQARAAAEIGRVTRPGGRLLLRTQFSDRMPRLWWLDHFPRGYEADAAMYATYDDVATVLGAAGWQVGEVVTVMEPSVGTKRQALQRLRLRTLSTFDQLTEAEQAVGFERLEQVVADDPDSPVPPVPSTILVAVWP